MRVTIIPSDRWIRRDDIAITLPEWPFSDSDIHAIQWHEDWGEIEFLGDPKPQNQKFTDPSLLDTYLSALDAQLLLMPS